MIPGCAVIVIILDIHDCVTKLRVFNKFVLKIKNHLCDVTKVLKKVVQISCPIRKTGIDCGSFAVVIWPHIFEGTEIGPHIFTQHDITKQRMCLPSLLAKERNERYYAFHLFLTTCHSHCHHCYPLKVYSQDPS